MLPWSVIAICGMPSPLHAANRSLSRAAPSSIEYSVCTCRCANGGLDTAMASGKTLGDRLRAVWGDSDGSLASALTFRGWRRGH